MTPMSLSPRFSVCPQLTLADVEQAAASGFRAIINNRPDGESPDQPASAVLEATARGLGLDYCHIPVTPGQLGEAEITALEQAMDGMDGPVLAFCRSGTRSAMLWALAEARRVKADALILAAQAAGYDLSSLRPRLASRFPAAQPDGRSG